MLASKLRHLFYGAAIATAISLYPVYSYSAQGCGTLKDNLNAALKAGFAPLFTAITDRALPIIMVVNRQGDWVILGIDENQDACPLARGTEFQLIIERAL